MAKAILTSRIKSDYDDLREERFHFPKKKTNLEKAEKSVGDWIVYYEPLKSGLPERPNCGRQSYFAIARVDRIAPDPMRDDHAYIYLSNYIEFDRPVAFREAGGFYESVLQRPDGTTRTGKFHAL